VIERPFWRQRLAAAWAQAPIVWLAGVRRSGKTTLARGLFPDDQAEYLNCDLPVVEDLVRDPQAFYRSCRHDVVVFDEVHQLRDPARLLKIGADEFPHLKILATGSSTLAATAKFRDTLAGRKRLVHLTPVTFAELPAFNATLPERLYRGGLPAALLAPSKAPDFYREWLDSFFARDIQRLFRLRDFNRFNAFFEYVLRQSGGAFEVTKAATALGITRPTVESHISALETTQAVTLVRPFHGGGKNELVKQPKVYGFDTGFVSFVRGWDPLRPDDMGVLWEHLVLEFLQAHAPERAVRYWRDKAGHEVDFILTADRSRVDAIECKWSADAFTSSSLAAFRASHPQGHNYLVVPSVPRPYTRRFGSIEVTVCTPAGLLGPPPIDS
jgi:predicted AAA+ superfamily ATPase